MSRYDERYDYGLRGSRPTPDGRSLDRSEIRDRRIGPRGPRVTARYNREYLFGGRGVDAYPRNNYPFGGDRPGRMVGSGAYRRPYLTVGGTRTFRGLPEPIAYDHELRWYDAGYRPFQSEE
jgi:hypothetical protein